MGKGGLAATSPAKRGPGPGLIAFPHVRSGFHPREFRPETGRFPIFPAQSTIGAAGDTFEERSV